MPVVVRTSALVLDARELAHTQLAELPERWLHSAGVARRAEDPARTVPPTP